ncbi:MAG: type II toxin-antitoxin system MqsR family toxin [Alphaproteobacteria bacterium]|nr:type II toxin-antitoxin system MqsR family toxin [Alphaproteobacteria bacterium]
MSEKWKPTYDLGAFKAACSSVRKLGPLLARSARISAAALGFGEPEIVEIIQTMQREHFYKSVTSFANHRLWHDAYHVPSEKGLLYVKFTADSVTGFALVSFKEK